MISDKLGGGLKQKTATLKGVGSFDVFLRLSLMARFPGGQLVGKSRNTCVFPMISGLGGWKRRIAKAR